MIDFRPQNEPLYLYRGDTIVASFDIENALGAKEDLTGCSVLMKVKATPESSDVLFTFDTEIDLEIDGDTVIKSRIIATIVAGDWATIDWNEGVYDIQVTYPSGIVQTFAYGTISVPKDVTP